MCKHLLSTIDMQLICPDSIRRPTCRTRITLCWIGTCCRLSIVATDPTWFHPCLLRLSLLSSTAATDPTTFCPRPLGMSCLCWLLFLLVTIDLSGFDSTFDLSDADARDFQCVPHTFVTLIGCVFSIHFVCYAGDQRERE